jgi:hypothetical protein
MSENKRMAIERLGFYEGEPGDYATTCIDNEDCIFVYREDGIAKCAIERAFNDGRVTFRKPISCHLYPIRINRFGGDVLRYHEIAECKPAIEKGRKENINVVNFVRSALVRNYGEKWFDELVRSSSFGEASADLVSVMKEKSPAKT